MLAKASSPRWTPVRRIRKWRLIEWWSPKLRRVVTFRSELASDAAFLFEIDPTIKEWCEEPLEIQGLDDEDNLGASVLDFGILRHDGSDSYFEVKYQTQVDGAEHGSSTWRQLSIQRRWGRTTGSDYRLITDQKIRNRPELLLTAKQILTARRILCGERTLADQYSLLEAIPATAGTTYEALRRKLALPDSKFMPAVADLVCSGALAVEPTTESLLADTRIWRHYGELKDHPYAGLL